MQLTVTRNEHGGADSEQVFFVRRGGAGLDARAAALATEAAGALGGALPSLGLRSCGAAAEPPFPYLLLELHIWLRGRPALRLRSDSRCAAMLPWNVSDGRQLAVLFRPQAGQALMRLVQDWCGACLPPLSAAPPPAEPVPQGAADFARLYSTLLSEWRRLQGRHGATEIKIATLALTDALDWMDHSRFERQLGRTAGSDGGAIGALARDLLRTLRVARWGYIDRGGGLVLAPAFEQAAPFSAGRALVRIDGAWRRIDRRGRGDGAAAAPPSPAPVPAAAVSLTPALPGCCAGATTCDVRRPWSDGLAAVRCGGLWGYVDRSGRMLIAPRFLEAGEFVDGLAPVR